MPMKKVALWSIAVPVGLCLHVLIMGVMNAVVFAESMKRRLQDVLGHSRQR